MKVKEPTAIYDTVPSIPVMRGRLMKALENEEDANFIQSMYVMMTQLKNASQSEEHVKYSLSDLKGILALDKDDGLSYDDMRKDYLKERYSL